MADPNGWRELRGIGFEQNEVRYFRLRVIAREIGDFIDIGGIGLEPMMRAISFDRETREQDGIQTNRISIPGDDVFPVVDKRKIIELSITNRYLGRRVVFPEVEDHGGRGWPPYYLRL